MIIEPRTQVVLIKARKALDQLMRRAHRDSELIERKLCGPGAKDIPAEEFFHAYEAQKFLDHAAAQAQVLHNYLIGGEHEGEYFKHPED